MYTNFVLRILKVYLIEDYPHPFKDKKATTDNG